jgi:hypothetical protein
MGKFRVAVTTLAAIGLFTFPVLAELGTNNPPDDQALVQRETETGCTANPALCTPSSANVFSSGNFDIALPPTGTTFRPAQRVRRNTFGVVGPLPLQLQDLRALVYPDATAAERQQLLEGLNFFTTSHVPGEGGAPNENGVGPINNQPFCMGCHMNAAEAVRSPGLLGPRCQDGSTCVSNVTRAARSTPTNFEFTSLDKATGGGVAPDNLDALNNTGKTAAFTTFGDFSSTLVDTAPDSIGLFDPLDGAAHKSTTSSFTSQPFGGFVQHHRPAVDACFPKPLPPVSFDANLTGPNPNQFRRTVGERAGPPYIGRGLIEAVPTANIGASAAEENGPSSLGNFAADFGCGSNGCIAGVANMIPRNFSKNTSGLSNGTDTGFVGGIGRFGLRANGVEMLQFIVGGEQGELSFTSLFNPAEINFPTLFPGGTAEAPEPAECYAALSQTLGQPYLPPGTSQQVKLNALEVHPSTAFSIRNLLRNTAPPEFGDALLDVLRSVHDLWSRGPDSGTTEVSWRPDWDATKVPWRPDSEEAKVKRGAELFGIDLVAFANRTIGGPMVAGGDGRDDHAIDKADRKLNCVGCHTPIQMTGQSPAAVGAEHLSFAWAPLFSDLLIHHMPVVTAERFLQSPGNLPRDPLVIPRVAGFRIVDTFDLPRNLADDTFSNAKASAEGSEFRTAPLMGIGRIGPPFLHDARVYLSNETVNSTPAGTVTTNRRQTNAPLVVRSVDDALLAAIELHDLPPPDDKNTPRTPGAGCPVPPDGTSNIDYGSSPEDVICPAYGSTNRSDAAEVMYRFHGLSRDDQQAVIEFLKQL